MLYLGLALVSTTLGFVVGSTQPQETESTLVSFLALWIGPSTLFALLSMTIEWIVLRAKQLASRWIEPLRHSHYDWKNVSLQISFASGFLFGILLSWVHITSLI